jgi:hypothetical protein
MYTPVPECATPEPVRLTYDEAKAAEAAFRGDPPDPAWTMAALRVYHGIVAAIEKRMGGVK